MKETHNVWVRWRKHVTSERKKNCRRSLSEDDFFPFSLCLYTIPQHFGAFLLSTISILFHVWTDICVTVAKYLAHTQTLQHDYLVFSSRKKMKNFFFASIRSINFEHFPLQACGNERKNMDTNVENAKIIIKWSPSRWAWSHGSAWKMLWVWIAIARYFIFYAEIDAVVTKVFSPVTTYFR